MKTIFVEACSKIDPAIPAQAIKRLPKKVALFTTIQYVRYLPGFKKQLEAAGKRVTLLKTRHTAHAGQLLGCNIEEFDGDFEAFFYVGDGLFHPQALVFGNAKPVFAWNPHTGRSGVVTKSQVQGIEKRRRAAFAAFMLAKEVGVLITTKYGQHPIQDSLERIAGLRREFPGKKFTFLLADTIDLAGLEDFPFIEVFLNTACPRIGLDDECAPKPLLNLTDLRAMSGSRNSRVRRQLAPL